MTISQLPPYPVSGDDVTLAASSTSPLPVVFELTSVPPQSALVPGLLLADLPANVTAPTSPAEALELGYEADSFVPDVPGSYGVTAYLSTSTSALPTYAGSPATDSRYVYDSQQTGTAIVC